MFRQILEKAIDTIHNHPKLIRIAFVTTFFHSLEVMLLLVYNVNNILHYRFHKGIEYSTIWTLFAGERSTIIIIFIIGLIGYEFFYPIGKSSMIHYLKNNDEKAMKAVGQGLEKFFPMLEFINLALLFNAITVITTIMRLTSLEIMNNPFIITIMILWTISAIVASFLRSYVTIAVNAEDMDLGDALKHSKKLVMQNPGITFKFFLLEGILIIRFAINLVIILGIPLLFIYIGQRLHIIDSLSNHITKVIVVVLLIFSAYLNAIIEAFFASYRYELYKRISSNGEDTDL